MIDNSNTGSLFQALSTAMSSVYLPALTKYDAWGELESNPQGQASKREFLKSTERFVGHLECECWLFIYDFDV